MRIPKHIGIIPDGNRRWALQNGFEKKDGYKNGLIPGIELFRMCKKLGIEEITYYGFTVDNTKRPKEQLIAFTNACVNAVNLLSKEDSELLVLGNNKSTVFPSELSQYTERKTFGKGGIKVNFLVNYSWEWDLGIKEQKPFHLNSEDVSRVDLVIRWGGRKRLSGFLPIQTVYSDFYFIDEYWPDFKKEHLLKALEWYSTQDITLGG